MSDIEKMIRIRAYALWERPGRPHGRSEEFWFLARAEFKARRRRAKGSARDGPVPNPEKTPALAVADSPKTKTAAKPKTKRS